jgi:multiple sugar transport system ATP-binding protein
MAGQEAASARRRRVAEIEFRNVSKSFGKTRALDDISFIVEDNAFYCLFGPPLSGKTTILRILLGLETPDSGEVLIDGKPVNELGPGERNLAMVFQNLALFPHMSARDNVMFPLAERKVPAHIIADRLADVASKLHIAHLLHKPPAHLSGGERQRVAIARALVRDPVACLMDDPISALDARLRESTRVELKRIQRELGRTLIYVTHDQEEAMSVADTMAILVNGEIQQIGTPSAIYRRPENVAVARLMGAPEINLLVVERQGPVVKVAEGTLSFPSELLPPGTCTIGFRPEDVRVSAWATSAKTNPATVFQVEPLGGSTVLTLDSGKTRLKALMRGQPDFKPDTKVSLAFDPSQMHAFGADGRAIR